MSIVRQRFKEGILLTVRADRLPRSVWGSNLRAFLPSGTWRDLSARTSARWNGECAICLESSVGGVGLDCNEMWEFIEVAGTHAQRLVGVIAMCELCHLTQHSGRAHNIGRYEDVMERLEGLNRWTQSQAIDDISASEREWAARSRFAWDLDLSVLAGWLELPDYPDLLVPASERDRLGNTHRKIRSEIRPEFNGEIPDAVWEWESALPVKKKSER